MKHAHESPPFLLRDLQHVSCARCSLDIPSTFSITVRHGVSLVMGSPHNGQHWFCLSHMNMRDFLPFKLSFIRIRFLGTTDLFLAKHLVPLLLFNRLYFFSKVTYLLRSTKRNNDLLLYFLHVWGKCGENSSKRKS